MRIVVEVPDTTLCVFMNYVYSTGSGLKMGCKSITTDDLEKIKVKEMMENLTETERSKTNEQAQYK